jgi:diamine N-acetyltransferase
MGRGVHPGLAQYESILMIQLRKSSVQDVEIILKWENDPRIWAITDQPGPFEREDIVQFLINSNQLERQGQARWMIEEDQCPVGMIDAFEYDRMNHEVGLGIIVMEDSDRKRGLGSEGLLQMESLLFHQYGIRKIWVLVHETNGQGQTFFERNGYLRVLELMHLGKNAIKLEKQLK